MWSVMQSTLGSFKSRANSKVRVVTSHNTDMRLFCTGLDIQKGCTVLQKQTVLSSAWEVS